VLPRAKTPNVWRQLSCPTEFFRRNVPADPRANFDAVNINVQTQIIFARLRSTSLFILKPKLPPDPSGRHSRFGYSYVRLHKSSWCGYLENASDCEQYTRGCAGPGVGRGDLSSNMLANWVLASHHSRGGICHFPATCARRRGAGLRLDGVCNCGAFVSSWDPGGSSVWCDHPGSGTGARSAGKPILNWSRRLR